MGDRTSGICISSDNPVLYSQEERNGTNIAIINFSFRKSSGCSPLRLISHNLLGTSVFAAFWLLLFYKIDVIRKKHAPILIVAVASHVIGDILFSGYSFKYPFENKLYVMFGWGTPEHMIVGSLLVFTFLGLFILNQDYSRLREYLHCTEQTFFREIMFNNIIQSKFIQYYLFFAFRLFIIVQLLLFIFSNAGNLSSGLWIIWFNLASFILCAVIFSTLTVKMNET